MPIRLRRILMTLEFLLLGHTVGAQAPKAASTVVQTASGCVPLATAQEIPLHLVYPATSELRDPARVTLTLEGDRLKVHFAVKTPTINARKTLAPNQYPYQYDVVEVFVSASGTVTHLPYYEFELSPYNQSYQVKIVDLKKPFIDGIQMGHEHSVHLGDGGWTADLSIPLKNLQWDGNPANIFGNAYAVFGKKAVRSYWSLALPVERKPNFHVPQSFVRLISNPTAAAGSDTSVCPAN